MELAHVIAFNLTLLAAIASPGPAMLYALRASLVGGFRTGFLTGAGLGTMAAIWTLLALLGLDGLFALFPWAYVAMKTIGALYLMWIAYQMWKDAKTPLDLSEASTPRRRAFWSGVLVNVANPKAILFASAVLLVIFPRDLTFAEKSFVVANHLAVEWLFYAAFAGLLSTRQAQAGYLRLKPILDRIAAAVLGALGLRLLLEK